MTRFVFDRDFDRELDMERGDAPPPERIYTTAEVQEELAAARAQAFAEGEEAGWKKAQDEVLSTADHNRLSALMTIAERMDRLLAGDAEHRAKLEQEILGFIQAVFEKVTPHALAAFGEARLREEIMATLKLALGSAVLRVRLSAEEIERLDPEIRRQADKLGLTARLDIAADAELAAGDGRVDWDDGFMEYSYAAVCERVLHLIRTAPPASEGSAASSSSAAATSRKESHV
ncbi:FliH/SctL family protein [Roseivivax sp.]